MERVSISQLKAFLSAYLAKVKAGKEILVTDRGFPVGKISPIAWDSDDKEALSALVQSGQLRPPNKKIKEEFFNRSKIQDKSGSLLAALLAEREESR